MRLISNATIKLDNTMLMYGIYNVETLEKLIIQSGIYIM